MKKIALFMSVFAMVTLFSSALFAADQDGDGAWQDLYVAALQKGMEAKSAPSANEGLGYTPSEETVLHDALSTALADEKGDRVCECLKMAVDLEYNPYLVLKTIYGVGGDLEIDQLCACATEAGIMKAIVAKAAKDAVDSNNKAVYAMDEVSQAQCLTEEDGLAYTRQVADLNAISISKTQVKAMGTESGATAQ